jgi:hypothetical protein
MNAEKAGTGRTGLGLGVWGSEVAHDGDQSLARDDAASGQPVRSQPQGLRLDEQPGTQPKQETPYNPKPQVPTPFWDAAYFTVAKHAKRGFAGDGRKLVAGVVDPGPASARPATTRRCFLGGSAACSLPICFQKHEDCQ